MHVTTLQGHTYPLFPKTMAEWIAASAEWKKAMSAFTKALPPEFSRRVAGRWQRPKLSGLQKAILRKRTLLAGEPWLYDPPKKPLRPVHMKGHRRIVLKQERAKKIEENMKTMPEKIEQYYKDQRARRKRVFDWQAILTSGQEVSGIPWEPRGGRKRLRWLKEQARLPEEQRATSQKAQKSYAQMQKDQAMKDKQERKDKLAQDRAARAAKSGEKK